MDQNTRNIYTDVYRLHEFAQKAETEEDWDAYVAAINRLGEKYGENPFLFELVCVVDGEVRRRA